MIVLEAVSKQFNQNLVVNNVSFVVEKGEFLVLLGGSGSGKTTTLKMINRLIDVSHGSIQLNHQNITDIPVHILRRRIGYCFQRLGLFPHLDVAANIGITPALLGWEKKRIRQRVDTLLTLVELDPEQFRHRAVQNLSGGQGQRVAVARALAAEPEVALFDEPFGALDPVVRQHLQQALLRIVKSLKMTCVFVTHDMLEAMNLADRIAVMRDGRIVQIGTTEMLMQHPADDYVTQLMTTPLRQVQGLTFQAES